LHCENTDARKAFVLLARDREGALMIFLRVAERAHTDMGIAIAELRIPISWIVNPDVAEVLRPCRHPDAESFGEAVQRVLRNTDRLKSRIADRGRQPCTACLPPIGRGIHVGSQSTKEFSARTSIVHAQKHMRAEVRCRPRPKHSGLDLVQL